MAKFYVEIKILDEIRGHLVILPYDRAQTRDSEGSLRKRTMKFKEVVLDIPNVHRTRLTWLKLKVKVLLLKVKSEKEILSVKFSQRCVKLHTLPWIELRRKEGPE